MVSLCGFLQVVDGNSLAAIRLGCASLARGLLNKTRGQKEASRGSGEETTYGLWW